ncbi:MAG: DUF134 domain-containing protein [Bacteroidales bacterium]|nr:DUF134 domain-containing protein [Bacteroidales bacterium]
MARKEKNRIVHQPPLYSEFKPAGVAARFLNQIELSLDEYEALRLADYEGMSQDEASFEMDISRPTFTRLIEKARKKMVEFIVTGKKLKIVDGNIHFKNNVFKCLDCEQMFVMQINETVSLCPSCSSENVTNLAGGFGHGRCCVDHED